MSAREPEDEHDSEKLGLLTGLLYGRHTETHALDFHAGGCSVTSPTGRLPLSRTHTHHLRQTEVEKGFVTSHTSRIRLCAIPGGPKLGHVTL